MNHKDAGGRGRALSEDSARYFEHLPCTVLGNPFSSHFPTNLGVPMPGSSRKIRNLSPQVPGAQPMSAQPGTCPWEQAIDLLPSFPHPWYQWVGNLGHRALGRGPQGRLVVTGRKLRPRRSRGCWEDAPATCPVWSISPSPPGPICC